MDCADDVDRQTVKGFDALAHGGAVVLTEDLDRCAAKRRSLQRRQGTGGDIDMDDPALAVSSREGFAEVFAGGQPRVQGAQIGFADFIIAGAADLHRNTLVLMLCVRVLDGERKEKEEREYRKGTSLGHDGRCLTEVMALASTSTTRHTYSTRKAGEPVSCTTIGNVMLPELSFVAQTEPRVSHKENQESSPCTQQKQAGRLRYRRQRLRGSPGEYGATKARSRA